VVLGVLVVSLVATLLGRLWYLQVMAAPQFRTEALDNQVRDVVTEAPRGQILDDAGRPLVNNKPALVVSVDRIALDRQADGGRAVLQRLATVLHTSWQKLDKETTPCQYVVTNRVHHGRTTRIVKVKTNPCWSGSAYEPVPVSQLRPTLTATRRALVIQEMPEDFPGVKVALTAVRHYPKPAGALASAMLGYIGPISQTALSKLSPQQQQVQRNTQVGVTGLEASYEKYLHGTPGVKQVTVDHVGAITGVLRNTVPTPGDDVVTNIDAKAQAALEKQLQNAINTARHSGFSADYAAGVILNVRTGGVVAMASDPTYPPSAFVPSISGKEYNKLKNEKGSPLVDKAFESAAAPGSTFKPISSSGLIKDGTMSVNGAYDCPQNYQNRHNFDGEAGLGFIPLRTALIVSCDTFFFALGDTDWKRDHALTLAHKKPREGVQHMARAYGFGEQPGIDLPVGEVATGHIADRANTLLNWKANKANYCAGAKRRPKGSYLQQIDADNCKFGYIFLPGDQMNEDVGQGTVTVSPLQLAVAYAAIANGGKVFEPRIAKAILSPTGRVIKRIRAPVRDHLPLQKSDLDYIRNALYGVTTSHTPPGTAVGAFAGFPMSKVLVGGKTGTAELSGTSQNGSWFASFGGPAGGPPQFVAVMEVNKSDQGAISAAPFVRNVWDALYGFGGTKAVFPNGLPPAKLPTVRRQPVGHHKSGAGPGPAAAPPASPSPSFGALGLPPALGIRFARAGGGTA
jgi:penicillin-binding protein 2